MSDYWGYMLSIDAAKADLTRISDKDNVANFARELVKRIEMIPFGDPQVVHFGEGNKEGLTLVQLISTSSITGHFVEHDGSTDGTGSYYIDIFSCKPYNVDTVIQTCREFFGNTTERIHYFVRQA